MKTKKIILLLGLGIVMSAFSVLHTTNLNLDSDASTVNWTGYAEQGGFAPEGTVKAKSGSLVYDHGRIASAEFVMDMKSINRRDNSWTSATSGFFA